MIEIGGGGESLGRRLHPGQYVAREVVCPYLYRYSKSIYTLQLRFPYLLPISINLNMSISSSICSADRASSEIDRVTKLEAELVALEAAAAESERQLSANIIAKRKHVDECYTNLEDLLTELHGLQSLE